MASNNNWTRTMNMCRCGWCNDIISRGEIMCKYDNQQIFNKKIRELISPKITEKGLPIGVRILIFKFYANPIPNVQGNYCEDCANFNIKLTRRGRVIRAPIRLETESFISGSGVGGCDQYDRGYGNDIALKKNWDNNCNLKDFVVSDEDEISNYESDISENEENISEWSDTDEEEEFVDWN